MRSIRTAGVAASLALALASCVGQPAEGVDAGDARIGGGERVATGQVIRPAGAAVEFNGRPVDVALSPDQKTLYVKTHRGLVVLDAALRVRQELTYPGGDGGSMHGLALARDGTRLYVTGAQKTIFEATIDADGKVAWGRKLALPTNKLAGSKGQVYPTGIALAADGKRAYACLSMTNTLGVLDLEDGTLTQQIDVGIAPYGVLLSADGGKAYVSNWGGRRPVPGDKTAKSAGSETVIDDRGVASTGTVSVVDLAGGKVIAEIAVGLHPTQLLLTADGRRLLVANANSDTVSVIDTASNQVAETIAVRPDASLPFGSAPNALALAADGKTLLVANGGNNAVAVVALDAAGPGHSAVQGFIPAGWYPGALALAGNQLYTVACKGIHSHEPKPAAKRWNSKAYHGAVSKVALPDAATLATYTSQVLADGWVPQMLRAWEAAAADAQPVPVPARTGEPSLIEHVIYVIKENRTYDQLFGDLPRGNNDPKLCIFGREVTPNHHALAEQFVLLDNYYCNGVISPDGHAWATQGNSVEYLEKNAPGTWSRSYPSDDDDPLAFCSSGFIWNRALAKGLSFRNYGETGYGQAIPDSGVPALLKARAEGLRPIVMAHKMAIESVRPYTNMAYPGWNLRIPDAIRADIFLDEWRTYEQKGQLPSLIVLYLPNDHTSGTSAGAPTPRAQVADNDAALGRVVEAVSKSRFWPKTCIFVLEDDPQDGFDHVDGHRSLCLVVSPYVKRGALVSEFYNQTSVLHTMERILGLAPMTQFDAMAPVMSACFTEKPDLTPYAALPPRIPLDEVNKPKSALRGEELKWAEASARQRLDVPDQIDEGTMNRILWYAQKGDSAPYPAALAGAHGKGLEALRLELERGAGEKDDD